MDSVDMGGETTFSIILGSWRVAMASSCGFGSSSFLFEYIVPIGRAIFLRKEHIQPTRLRAWLHAGLSHAFTGRFWRHIWSAVLHVDDCTFRIGRGDMVSDYRS